MQANESSSGLDPGPWVAVAGVPPATLLISLLPAAMCVGTVLGNFLVLAAVVLSTGHPTTLLLANLAVADFLVGVVVMPLAVSNILTRSKWIYGKWMCKAWVSLDVICCTASIVTLCAISGDRFIGVTRPLQYSQLVTRRRVLYCCVAIWVASVTILIATVRWRGDATDECNVGQQLQYVVHSTVASFFVPLTVICLLYYRIFQVAYRRERSLLHCLSNVFSPQSSEDRVGIFLPLRVHYGGAGREQLDKQSRAFRKQKKTAKTLGIVVGAFIVCWTPFFILHSLNALLPQQVVPALVMDVFTWLGYFNSTLNPFIYGTTMRSFKNSFRYLMQRTLCSLPIFRSHKGMRGSMSATMSTPRSHCTDVELSLSNSRYSLDKSPTRLPARALELTAPKCDVPLTDDKHFLPPNVFLQTDFNLKLYELLISSESTEL